jgi:hypothetical protein
MHSIWTCESNILSPLLKCVHYYKNYLILAWLSSSHCVISVQDCQREASFLRNSYVQNNECVLGFKKVFLWFFTFCPFVEISFPLYLPINKSSYGTCFCSLLIQMMIVNSRLVLNIMWKFWKFLFCYGNLIQFL